MHKILKSFPYSHDGVCIVQLREGDEADFRAELVAGLMADGLIGPVGAATIQALDPAAATADELRAFLMERGVSAHHRAGLDKLREMATAELTKG